MIFLPDPPLIMIRSTLGLVDDSNRVIGIFVGPPEGDVTWSSVHEGVRVALADAKRRMLFTQRRDRRGTFKTIAAGLSYGGGQRVSCVHWSSQPLT